MTDEANPTLKAAEPIDAETDARPICGLIMPIADTPAYEPGHWKAVDHIIQEALAEAGFRAKLVSEEFASGVIHKRIVTNLYENEIVVCDVSGKNPNVMFELGMRLAFDRPTVLIKDDRTDFSFDTNPIEHLVYPAALTYGQIVLFKKELGRRTAATVKAAKNDPNYSTFLRHFAAITPAKLPTIELPMPEYVVNRLDEISRKVDAISDRGNFLEWHIPPAPSIGRPWATASASSPVRMKIELQVPSDDAQDAAVSIARRLGGKARRTPDGIVVDYLPSITGKLPSDLLDALHGAEIGVADIEYDNPAV